MFSPTVVFVAAATVYFVPGLVAVVRRRPDQLLIVASNVLFGGTVLGWIGSLLWACRTPRPKASKAHPTPKRPAHATTTRAESRRRTPDARSRYQWDDLEGREQYAAWLEHHEAGAVPRRSASTG